MFRDAITFLKKRNLHKESDVLLYLLSKYATSENDETTEILPKETKPHWDEFDAFEASKDVEINAKDSALYKFVYDYIKNIAMQIGREPNSRDYIFHKKDAYYVVNKAKQFDDNLRFFGLWKDNPNLLKPMTFKKFVKKVSSDVLSDTGAYYNFELYEAMVSLLTDIYNDFYMIDVLNKEFDLSEAMRKTDAGSSGR